MATLDTGADITTLDADWAPQLGIDLANDCELVEVGAASDKPVYHHCYAEGLMIDVVGEPLFLPLVMFCKREGIALLGRQDFFQRYLALIDEPGNASSSSACQTPSTMKTTTLISTRWPPRPRSRKRLQPPVTDAG